MKRFVKTTWFAISCVAIFMTASMASGESAAGSTLRVVVTGMEHVRGKVNIGLYNNATGFPGIGGAVQDQTVAASSGKASCVFRNVPPGDYAVAVFHDENDNGQLDKNLFGMPREGTGFSRNAKGRLGPPSFESASFQVSAPMQISLKMRY